jgi:diguanylate cyclase
MSETPNPWRDKYLNALDVQEHLEVRLAQCQDALRRAYIHLGAAIGGQDAQLDAALGQLKERLRQGASADLLPVLEQVETHLSQLETLQDNQSARLVEALVLCCRSLRHLRLPKPLQARLLEFVSGLEHQGLGVGQLADALNHWHGMLQEALAAAALPDASLWDRLRGGRRLVNPSLPPSAETPFYQNLPPNPTRPPVEPDLQLDGWEEGANLPSVPKEQQPVAAHISTVLQQLLDVVNPKENLLPQLNELRTRIDKGLSWQDLGEILEGLRDIFVQSYLAVDSELGDYLEKVNDDLAQICQNLGLALAKSAEAQKQQQSAGQRLNQQVAAMQQSLKNATNLEGLKREVSAQITSIQNALAQTAQQQQWHEDLQQLLGRLQTIESQSKQTQAMLERERHRATHDSLTELPNREAYNQRIKLEWQRYKRYGEGFTLAICDIDHFKKFNDQFGHQVGDRVLKLVSKALAKRLREVDFVARYGGEEFVVILPHTNLPKACKTLDKIRAAIASLAFRFRDEPVKITLSFGLAQVADKDTVASLFKRADDALYLAKAQGRNCIKVLPEGAEEE